MTPDELQAENQQLNALLRYSEETEEECIKILEPLVGYDRDLPYGLRLAGAVRQLASNFACLKSENERLRAALDGVPASVRKLSDRGVSPYSPDFDKRMRDTSNQPTKGTKNAKSHNKRTAGTQPGYRCPEGQRNCRLQRRDSHVAGA